MSKQEYEVYLADQARKAGKRRRHAGVCCFYQRRWSRSLVCWSVVLTIPLIFTGMAIFSARTMLLAGYGLDGLIDIESDEGDSAGPAWYIILHLLYASFSLGIGFGLFAMCAYCFYRDEGDLKLEQDVGKIDSTVAELLHDGTIRLLSCEWLRGLGMSAPPLMRLQDLPPEAFLSPGDAVKAHEQGSVYVLSYGWASAPHPDPQARTLRTIIAFLNSAWLRSNAKAAVGMFIDWASLPQKDPTLFDPTETPDAKSDGAERDAFQKELDAKRKFFGGEAYEKSRSPEEKAIFDQGLGAMGKLYGSLWRTTVIQYKGVYDGVQADGTPFNTKSYDDRGWTGFEDGAAKLAAYYRLQAKVTKHDDRSRLTPKLIDVSSVMSSVDEPKIVKVSGTQRPSVEALERRIQGAFFFGKGDKEMIVSMLKDYNTLLSFAKTYSKDAEGWANRPFSDTHDTAEEWVRDLRGEQVV